MAVSNGIDNSATPSDTADIAGLWIDTGVGDPLTSQHLHNVPIGKPRDFFRIHPDPEYRRTTEIYEHKPEGSMDTAFYLVAPEMRGLVIEARPCLLVCAVDRVGSPRLWPIMSPRDGERDNEAWSSARAAAREGLTQWVRLLWVRRAYTTRHAQLGYAPDPDFSKLPTFDELVRLAFGTHGIIRGDEHPIYKALFGAADARGNAFDL